MRLERLLAMLDPQNEDAFILFAIAKEYENKGDEATALSYYNKLVSTQPNYVGTYYNLGKLHERAQAFEAAVSVYEAGMAVAKVAKDQHAYNELAAAKFSLSDD